MSFARIGLGKFLILIALSQRSLQSKCRDSIRKDIKKEKLKKLGKLPASGGDFYGPFWFDAKAYVADGADLKAATLARINDYPLRDRLYRLLQKGFLSWWNERRRLRNEPFKVMDENPKGSLDVVGIGSIKVENTLYVLVGGIDHRIIYPYFSEKVALSEDNARIGLWIMAQCLKEFTESDMRIVDVLRSRSFSVAEVPFKGDEEFLFNDCYRKIADTWNKLRL